MALYDQIRQNLTKNASGQLASSSGEELQNASAAMDRASVPTVPSEAAVITDNPDVAKMAGTPNNLANAIRQSVKKEMDRGTVERTQPPKTVLSEADKAKQFQEKQLAENIKDLPQRVQTLAQAKFQQASTTGSLPTLNTVAFDAERPQGMTDINWAASKDIANKLTTGTATTTDIAQLQNLLGKPIDQAALSKWISGPQEAIAASISAALPDTALLSEVYPEPEKQQAVAEALGIPVAQVAGMSFKQFQQAVKENQANKFSETQKLRQQATDASLSPAERDAARRALRDAGASGISSIERDAASVEARIADGDQITFNGKQVGLEEALSDDSIKGTIKRFFEEPDFAAKLTANEPDLVNLINGNRQFFESQAAASEPALADFQRIQEANKGISALDNGLRISDDVMKQLIPDWGKASGTQFTEPPLITAVKSFPAGEQVALVNNMAEIAKYPELMVELSSMDANMLAKEGMLDKAKVDTLLNSYAEYRRVENAAPNALGEADVRNMLGGKDASEYADKLDDYWSLVNLGQDTDGSVSKFLNLIDANQDGVPDAPSVIIDNAKGIISGGGSVNLKSLLARGIPSPANVTTGGLSSASSSLAKDSVRAQVSKFKGIIQNNGTLDTAGLARVEKMSMDDVIELTGHVGVSSSLVSIINTKADERVSKLVSSGVSLSISSGDFSKGDSEATDEMYAQLKIMNADSSIPQIVKDKFRQEYTKASKLQQTYVATKNRAANFEKKLTDNMMNESVKNPRGPLVQAMRAATGYAGPMPYFDNKMKMQFPPEFMKAWTGLRTRLNGIKSGSQNKKDVELLQSVNLK